MGHLGCQADVLDLADRRCSGRRRCLIRVPDAELESRQPCLRELKTYLFASYRCVHGAITIFRECCSRCRFRPRACVIIGFEVMAEILSRSRSQHLTLT